MGKLFEDKAESLEDFKMFCGYVLADHCRYERFLALCGDAEATGAVFRVMAMAAGEDKTIEIDVIAFSCFGRMAFRNAWLARYRGKLPRNSEHVEQFFRLVTGDFITAEAKMRPRISFRSRAKIVCFFQEPPTDADTSITRKMILVSFPVSLPEDFETPLHFHFEEEKDGILRWMEEGLEMLAEKGGFGR
ncbi:MAG: hypothetical protein HZB23_03450 [Deltaproteobacteria bacterium]|nr:hypothetical protein [Deltaproteobacteria bacterium]